MDRDAKQSPDAPMPGLTVQRKAPTVASQSRLIGTLEIDTSTNCLVVRTPISTVPGTESLVDVDVAWPPGWSVALYDGTPALIDAAGQLAGRPLDEVDVGGGLGHSRNRRRLVHRPRADIRGVHAHTRLSVACQSSPQDAPRHPLVPTLLMNPE
jgi:hypothetical protein